MGRLDGKVAIVTGAGTGIGEAIAKKFAYEGAKVVVNGLPGDPIKDVADSIHKNSGSAVMYAGDISEDEHAIACVQTAISTYGRLDVLVNNAGVYHVMAETDKFSLADFDYMLKMNVRSAFVMTKHALPYIQKTRGSILFAGSEAGLLGQPECTPYSGTKAFLFGMARGLALEQARYGVRVNVVCPGPIETSWHDPNKSGMTSAAEKMIEQATPMGRHGTTEEAANVYAFLASDEASFVTGALYFVDGGMSISRGAVGDQVPRDLRKQPKGVLEIDHDTTPSAGNHPKPWT
jgi:NAD(P)-dependent dehydrogenase (short-subunit alcohol dehydrogenase family)